MENFAKLATFIDRAKLSKTEALRKLALQVSDSLAAAQSVSPQVAQKQQAVPLEGSLTAPAKQFEDIILHSAMPELAQPDPNNESLFGKCDAKATQCKTGSWLSFLKKKASAYLGDVELSSLPKEVQNEVERLTGLTGPVKVIQYGAVASELLPKADKLNIDNAISHVKQGLKGKSQKVEKEQFFERAKDKYIIVLNDKIIDGHHMLAKAHLLDITCSLKVLDLTPIRFQKKANLLGQLRKSICQKRQQ